MADSDHEVRFEEGDPSITANTSDTDSEDVIQVMMIMTLSRVCQPVLILRLVLAAQPQLRKGHL